MKKLWLMIILGGILMLGSCQPSDKIEGSGDTVVSPSDTVVSPSDSTAQTGEKIDKNPQATIEMENGDKIVIELFFDKAPNTVRNFVSLAQDGFFDGLTFHRVISGFMVQGGDPEGTGSGGPGYTIEGEFKKNGVDTGISHVRGTISMARQGDPSGVDSRDQAYYNTASCQFFIVHNDSTFLDEKYAAFGSVIEGMDTVDRIAAAETDARDKPVEPQVMKQVTVELFGQTIDKPTIIK